MEQEEVKQEEVKCVALGDDVEMEVAVVQAHPGPLSTDQRLSEQQQQLTQLARSLDSLSRMVKELRDDYRRGEDERLNGIIEEKTKANKMELPEGTELHGKTKSVNFFCVVRDGGFYVGITRYDSLSAAALGVSGVRRSGWTFWKLPNGKTVKEVYKT